MLDVHCHILPGLDDGPEQMEEAIAMAACAAEDGVQTICATSHFSPDYHNPETVIRHKTRELQEQLDRRSIPVQLVPANEVRLVKEYFAPFNEAGERFTYIGARQRYLLVEQAWAGYAADTDAMMDYLLERGTRPIIAHPERHDFFRAQPELLVRLIGKGVWTQVTADSLIGRFGPEAQQFAEWLGHAGLVHLMATDAHNMQRKPNLSEGMQLLQLVCGEQQVQAVRERMRLMLQDM